MQIYVYFIGWRLDILIIEKKFLFSIKQRITVAMTTNIKQFESWSCVFCFVSISGVYKNPTLINIQDGPYMYLTLRGPCTLCLYDFLLLAPSK